MHTLLTHSCRDLIRNSATGYKTCEEQSSIDNESYHRVLIDSISIGMLALRWIDE